MKFYVPEIGDEIILEEDWSFGLFPERRNEHLAAFYGHYRGGFLTNGWIDSSVLPPMRPVDYKVNYPKQGVPNTFFGKTFDRNIWEKECKLAEENCPEYKKWHEDREIWREQSDKIWKPVLDIKLPKGTRLKIDRIYIRKGSKDFSSITFFAKDLGEITTTVGEHTTKPKKIKKKSLRFWAKLVDCNKIVFSVP